MAREREATSTASAEHFQMMPNSRSAGASHASPVAITAAGIDDIRSWLALLIKTFQLNDQTILSMIIDGAKAAVHWRARIYSRITGATVMTELVDLVEVRNDRIASYTEFFVPRSVQ